MHKVKLPTTSDEEKIPRKKSGKMFKKFLPIFIVVAILVFVGFILSAAKGPGQVVSFIFQDIERYKSTDDKVNILLLGNAGGIHDGAYLTDTIMVASINTKDNRAFLISLPRDLWIDETKSKLNAVYEIGDDKNNGLGFSKQTVSNILGIPIHYGVRLDFRGFTKAVNEVGGIDVEVERSFQDFLYPIEGKENDLCDFKEEEKEFNEEEAKALNIEKGKRKVLIAPDGKIATDSAEPQKGYEYFGCRFETISFKAGTNQMDGGTALKFVRSRMGTNGEGNDFARSKRQQKVIDAFRKKVLSVETLINPIKIKGLIEAFDQSFETDIPVDDMLELHKLVKNLDSTQSFVINSTGTESLLINPPLQDYGGAWVLIPKEGSFSEIQQFVEKILRGEVTDEATNSARPSNR